MQSHVSASNERKVPGRDRAGVRRAKQQAHLRLQRSQYLRVGRARHQAGGQVALVPLSLGVHLGRGHVPDGVGLHGQHASRQLHHLLQRRHDPRVEPREGHHLERHALQAKHLQQRAAQGPLHRPGADVLEGRGSGRCRLDREERRLVRRPKRGQIDPSQPGRETPGFRRSFRQHSNSRSLLAGGAVLDRGARRGGALPGVLQVLSVLDRAAEATGQRIQGQADPRVQRRSGIQLSANARRS